MRTFNLSKILKI